MLLQTEKQYVVEETASLQYLKKYSSSDEAEIVIVEGIDDMDDVEKNQSALDTESCYLALVSKSYQNLMTAYHEWAQILQKKKRCSSSVPRYRFLLTLFIVVTTVTMGCSMFATISKYAEEGSLTHYKVIIDGVKNIQVDEIFSLASKEEQKSFVLSLWYNNMLTESFALWTIAIITSADAEAIPITLRLAAYCLFIPLMVLFQWAADTSILYMYLDYISVGHVKHAKLMTWLWYIFQLASWSMQCICLLVILGSIGGQLLITCRRGNHQVILHKN
jgi:hypothetical protein